MIVSVDSNFQVCHVLQGAACAFGVFDGVHQGHQFIINSMLHDAAQQGIPRAVITFAQDPDELFCPKTIKKLMPNSQRISMLDACGANYVVVLPCTKRFFALTPEQFLKRVFSDNVPASMHVGENFRFGAKAQGSVATLTSWGAVHNMRVCAHELLMQNNNVVSSSRIRQLLAAGAITQANDLLGRPFALEGTVQKGRGEGQNMGFRTANLSIPAALYTLGEGVYGAYAITEAGKRYKAAVSVGGAPSFGKAATANIEAHIIDFDQDIYCQQLRLEFVAYLRPMRVFRSKEQLIATVMNNIQWCKDNL